MERNRAVRVIEPKARRLLAFILPGRSSTSFRRLVRAAVLFAAGLLVLHPAGAATITWGPATTIAGDADVSTNGTAVYAYDQSNTGATVNGVAFAAGSSTNSLGGGQVSLNFDAVNNTAFGGDTGNPWNSLSSSYQTLLKGGGLQRQYDGDGHPERAARRASLSGAGLGP